jgi:hypothetical protein
MAAARLYLCPDTRRERDDLPPAVQLEIHRRLYARGMGLRAIARELRIDRKTVRRRH